MVRPDVSRPAGRAESTERGAAGARDNLSAAPATWLSILGLLRVLLAPLQLPRHPRVSQLLDLLPRHGSLGPAPLVRYHPAGGPGSPWHAGHLGDIWRGLAAAAKAGGLRAAQARPGARTARPSRVARPPGGFPPPGTPPVRGRPEATPLSLPGTPRPLVWLGLPAQRASLRPLPSPGGCWPLPLVSFAPHSVPTSSALLTGSGAGQVYPRCEASC